MDRTGKVFGYHNYDIKPDLISMAKALANGYPIGAFIASKSLGEVFTPGNTCFQLSEELHLPVQPH